MRQITAPLVLALALAAPAFAKEEYAFGDMIKGEAVALDGVTLRLFPEGADPVDVRLWGIKVPEMEAADGSGWAARAAMDKIVREAAPLITCQVQDADQHGRPVAICRGSLGKDMGLALITAGWAVEDRTFTRANDPDLKPPIAYIVAEGQAMKARRGRWKRIYGEQE